MLAYNYHTALIRIQPVFKAIFIDKEEDHLDTVDLSTCLTILEEVYEMTIVGNDWLGKANNAFGQIDEQYLNLIGYAGTRQLLLDRISDLLGFFIEDNTGGVE